MSSYSDYIKKASRKENERFFGEIKSVSNKYFTFDRIIDNDNIIIITNNLLTIKGNQVLVVGENKAVYLKDWCVKPIHNYYAGIDGYAVKLCRQYFKPYTFRGIFEGYEGTHEMTFDSLVDVAKSQNAANMSISIGHMG